MCVGEKSNLTCTPDFAYGDRGAPPTIPPNATLVFEVKFFQVFQFFKIFLLIFFIDFRLNYWHFIK